MSQNINIQWMLEVREGDDFFEDNRSGIIYTCNMIALYNRMIAPLSLDCGVISHSSCTPLCSVFFKWPQQGEEKWKGRN